MRLSSFRNKGVIFARVVGLQGQDTECRHEPPPDSQRRPRSWSLRSPLESIGGAVIPTAGSPRRALKLRQIGQSFTTIGDQKLQQSLTAHGVDPTALNPALAALRHQSRGNQLRDVVGERRFRDAKLILNRADGQAALPGSDQQAKYLQAMPMTQLCETSRCVLERHAARLGWSPHPQPRSSGRGARRREGSRRSSVASSIR